MSKHDKVLAKLCATPTTTDLKWDDLKGFLEKLGYAMSKGSGSRRKFYHTGKNALIICHQPHPSPEVDKGCVVDIREHLKINGFI